jgi:heat shock protein HtpX
MWFSRRREFRADAGGAKLAGPRNMIDALHGLKRVHVQRGLPKSMQAFGINGARVAGLRKLFMSHPPIDERIAALESSAAGR